MNFVIILVLLFIAQDSNGFVKKSRNCCKYSDITDKETRCPNTTSCTLSSSLTQQYIYPNLAQCFVQLDSKKDDNYEACPEGKKIWIVKCIRWQTLSSFLEICTSEWKMFDMILSVLQKLLTTKVFGVIKYINHRTWILQKTKKSCRLFFFFIFSVHSFHRHWRLFNKNVIKMAILILYIQF